LTFKKLYFKIIKKKGGYMLILSLFLFSQWVPDGMTVCGVPGAQENHQIISDETGGAIIVWQDYRDTLTIDLYAQRIDLSGNILWNLYGVPVCTTVVDQYYPAITQDGLGGFFIVWEEAHSGLDQGIYAQRLSSSGSRLWDPSGIEVCDILSFDQFNPHIIFAGIGEAFVAWLDNRNGNIDIYAQKIDTSGSLLWDSTGVPVCTTTVDQDSLYMISDNQGGIIIAWIDTTTGSHDIFAQRLDASGNVLWGPNGVPVCTTAVDQWAFRMTPDGSGGAIVVWEEPHFGTDEGVYAQRISSTGNMMWGPSGIKICDLISYNQVAPKIISDRSGGAVIIWIDDRNGNADIYAQRVNSSGNLLWDSTGVPVCVKASLKFSHNILNDEYGGFIITWVDSSGGDKNIYAQKLDLFGNIHWASEGAEICTASGNQSSPDAVSDGTGGAIVVWKDDRYSDFDIYAQRVNPEGIWGIPEPTILSVDDIPNDQGGKVEIIWQKSTHDLSSGDISYYSIWRSISSKDVKESKIIDPKNMNLEFSGEAHRITQIGGKAYAWEWLANIPAHYFDYYSYAAQTLYDSTSGGTGYTYFLVSAHVSDTVFYDSDVDSGYSVDNLSPAKPQNLSGAYVSPSYILIWNKNTEEDLSHYAVYRGDTPDFVPSLSNRIGTPTDTIFTDTTFPGFPVYYKVSAIDIHENESDYALLEATGIGEQDNDEFSNIFTKWLILKGYENKTVNIYNLTGQKVGEYSGKRVGENLKPGIYFIRLEHRIIKITKVK